jgi:VanZ family protein
MHNLILCVRHLRRIALFEVSTRALIIILMVLGSWVATRHLEWPEEFYFNDKLIHAFVFFAFSVLMDLASDRKPFWLWKGLPLLIYGILIEVMQYFTPDREFSYLDMLADLAGIVAYFFIKSLLVWLDSKRLRKTL